LLKYNIFLVDPSLRMGDFNADTSPSSMPPINSSAHNISRREGANDVPDNRYKRNETRIYLLQYYYARTRRRRGDDNTRCCWRACVYTATVYRRSAAGAIATAADVVVVVVVVVAIIAKLMAVKTDVTTCELEIRPPREFDDYDDNGDGVTTEERTTRVVRQRYDFPCPVGDVTTQRPRSPAFYLVRTADSTRTRARLPVLRRHCDDGYSDPERRDEISRRMQYTVVPAITTIIKMC